MSLTLAALAALPAAAHAQSVRLDQYRMGETPVDGFSVSRPNDLGHLSFGARLDLDYALNPLVYQVQTSDPTTERASIVEHLVGGTLGLSFGLFERIVIFAGLPVNLMMDGTQVDGQPRADGTSLGDVYFGLRGRLYGETEDPFAISLQVTGTGPTAQAARFQSRFAGEGDWTIHPELLIEGRFLEIVRVTGTIGALVRREQDFGALRVGHELTWGLAAAVSAVPDVLDITAEAWGASSFDRFADPQVSPVEGVLGLRVMPVTGLSLGLAAGTGLQRGYGAGDFRAIFTLGYATPGETEVGDTDGDGLRDDVDQCVDDPEDPDGFEDDDGCPDADNDADGILDEADECPNEAEDMDGLGDEDGCPELDFDGDGAADESDRCPSEPGVALAPRPECTGCPTCDSTPPPEEPAYEPPPAAAPSFSVRVHFGLGSDELRGSERQVMDAALAYLQNNPDASVAIEGHADFFGADGENLQLSRRRARNVMRWLRRMGVTENRLHGSGCGETYPAETNESPEGRRENRRVEINAGELVIRSNCSRAGI